MQYDNLGSWTWDESESVIHLNSFSSRILDYWSKVFAVGDIAKHIHPDDMSYVRKMWSVIQEAGTEAGLLEFRILDAKKTSRTIRISFQLSFDSNKKVKRATGTLQNITEQTQLEQALESFFYMSADMLCVVGGNGYLKQVNAALEKITNYSREELLSKLFVTFFHEADREKLGDAIRNAIESGGKSHVEARIKARKEGWKWLSWSFSRFSSSGDLLYAVVRDISERKNVQDVVVRQQNLLKNVLSNIPHSVFWKDCQSVYLGCNENFARDAGLEKAEDIIGKTDFDLAWKKEEAEFFRKCDKQVIMSKKPMLDIEEPQLQADGREAVLLTSKVPLKDSSGCIFGILGIYVDITGQKMVQQELENKNTALKEVLSQIELEKKSIREDVLSNVDNLLLPLIQKMKMQEAGVADGYVDLMEKTLGELSGSFGRRIDHKLSRLSPKEIEISNMIKNGLTMKEMANLLSTSPRTVETHRRNIRKKLGIANKKINLATYLSTL